MRDYKREYRDAFLAHDPIAMHNTRLRAKKEKDEALEAAKAQNRIDRFNMLDVIQFLHDLRRAVIEENEDETTIVRFDVDQETPDKILKLVVITGKVYYPFTVDASDTKEPQHMIEYCLNVIRAKG